MFPPSVTMEISQSLSILLAGDIPDRGPLAGCGDKSDRCPPPPSAGGCQAPPGILWREAMVPGLLVNRVTRCPDFIGPVPIFGALSYRGVYYPSPPNLIFPPLAIWSHD